MYLGAEVVVARNIKFIILEDRIIVSTRLQSVMLLPVDYCWRKRLETIKFLIRIGEIKDLNTLASSCIERSAKRRVIEWIPMHRNITM